MALAAHKSSSSASGEPCRAGPEAPSCDGETVNPIFSSRAGSQRTPKTPARDCSRAPEACW
eukprot:7257125-Lingulodinium_polyedra.AAC.1